MVVLDTSAVLASIDRREPHHQQVVDVMSSDLVMVMPIAILSEVTFMIEQRLGPLQVARFLASLVKGEISLYWDHGDLKRILELLTRYQDMPLGFADAAVIACAERHGGKVLTLDRRHFGVVEREGTIRVLP